MPKSKNIDQLYIEMEFKLGRLYNIWEMLDSSIRQLPDENPQKKWIQSDSDKFYQDIDKAYSSVYRQAHKAKASEYWFNKHNSRWEIPKKKYMEESE